MRGGLSALTKDMTFPVNILPGGTSPRPFNLNLTDSNQRKDQKFSATVTWAASSAARLESKQKAVAIDTRNYAYKDGNALRVPMNETASEDLLEKWLSQAVSGFMAALASKRLEQMAHEDREEVHSCSKQATTVPEHARCVVKVLDSTSHLPVKDTPIAHLKKKTNKISQRNEELEWTGSFGQARAKRQAAYKVVSRESYKLKTMRDEPLMTQVAKQLTRSVRKLKNKSVNSKEGWRNTVLRVKKVGEEARKEKKQRLEMKKRLRMMIDNTPDEFLDPRKPIAIKKMEMEDEDMAIKKMMVRKQKDEIRVPMELMREAVKAALEISGQNTTGFEKKTLKMLSPRFMSIVPEQEDDSLFNLLSPSLFSLHEDGQANEQLFSLPKILKKLNNSDQEAWMDFIVEASGVVDTVDKTEADQKARKEKEMRGDDGTPLFFTKKNMTEIGGEIEVKKIEVFEQLDKSYNEQQKAELDKQGYAFLTDEQLDMVYGPNSPYKKASALRRFKSKIMRDDPHRFIETDIRALAEAEKFKVRRHDIVGSPFLLSPLTFAGTALSQPVYLSPLVLSPITLSPAVLGPITLSPWVFIPLVLSPRVLSPLILSPLVFSPIVLSPLVLHPLILVPGVFNPLILTPLVLSPLILSPQVFSPLILSPLVLNPLILTPMVGSPLILSPFVLSPLIVSPQVLFAVVLSPYALSPLIESKLIASEVVLSPSWLS